MALPYVAECDIPVPTEDQLKKEFQDAATRVMGEGCFMFLLRNFPGEGDSSLEGLFVYAGSNWGFLSPQQRKNAEEYYMSEFDGHVQKRKRLDRIREECQKRISRRPPTDPVAFTDPVLVPGDVWPVYPDGFWRGWSGFTQMLVKAKALTKPKGSRRGEASGS